MNPYQEVIDWLRSAEGSRWSENRMKEAAWHACMLLDDGSGAWSLISRTGDTLFVPLYMGGVLSVKEDSACGGASAECRFEIL